MSNVVELPRLLYLADVPVETSYHGSALLYRLLENYPKDKLVIVEAGPYISMSQRRISNIVYRAAPLPVARLNRTQFWAWYHAAQLRLAKSRALRFIAFAREIQAEAILTVTHGISWITAAEVARRLDIPLHLICHDEWARTGFMQDWKDKAFVEHYRRASSRLCVSPFMSEEYERRYGARGEVLYPSRARDAVIFDAPPARLARYIGPLTCVFAGTINSPGAVAALRSLAACLEPSGGRLVIFGPLSASVARLSGLVATNIELGGLLTSAELIKRLREMADVLYVPMSFEETDRNNMQIGFPSKLTDYTAIGVPLMIHGPAYCSAVCWALENRGVAEVVTADSTAAIGDAISRLAAEPTYRLDLGRRALEVGETYFSHRAASSVFMHALMRDYASYRDGRVATAPAGAVVS